MADQDPPGPEEILRRLEAAEKAASELAQNLTAAKESAERSADKAGKHCEKAQKAASTAQEEAESYAKDRKYHMRIAIIELFVSIVVFFAIAAQALYMGLQHDQTNVSLRNARDQGLIGFFLQLRKDTDSLQVAIADPQGGVQLADALDPHCTSNQEVAADMERSIESTGRQFLAHHQYYHDAMARLGLPDEWQSMCLQARSVLDGSCHLSNALSPMVDKMHARFKGDFQTCTLSHPSGS